MTGFCSKRMFKIFIINVFPAFIFKHYCDALFISKQTDIIGWIGLFCFFDTNDIFYNYYLFD